MPNTRRRRFSVQHEISGRNTPNLQNTGQSSPDSELKTMPNLVNAKANKKPKAFPNSSKNASSLVIIAESDSSTSVMTVKEQSCKMINKEVTAIKSHIDSISSDDNPSVQSIKPTAIQKELPKLRETKPTNRDRISRREKVLPRQHCVKVRSPKRRLYVTSDDCNDKKHTVGINAIDWDQEVEVSLNNITAVGVTEEDRTSNHSTESMCRICHGGEALNSELGPLISACLCRGTVGRIHVKCLERWLTESGKSRCELCGNRYTTRRVHRYGVPRALVMWLLSQNAKQLIVDTLGIMLMSPLAILAAWLSGRTLSGLMTQEAHVTPWPLASTFVLACMTLVCYYCWVVSAASRHALGWWMWYRSQYEVRLEFDNDD